MSLSDTFLTSFIKTDRFKMIKGKVTKTRLTQKIQHYSKWYWLLFILGLSFVCAKYGSPQTKKGVIN